MDGASDELKLLDVIEEQGYGNWDAIGQRMCKSSEECYSHYHRYYLNEKPLISTSSSHDESHDSLFLPANYPGEEISHYNPLRADFEIEREKRKSVIREHGLIDVYRILGRERLLSNEEQSVRVLMRRFARFLDAETTEKLTQSFLNEKRLIRRIKCLQTYRCLGIKTLAARISSIVSTEQQNATVSCTNTELQGQQAMCSTGKKKYSLTPLNIIHTHPVWSNWIMKRNKYVQSIVYYLMYIYTVKE
uniref:SANT domain-containing protein n=1 Tax=Amphimedon queenslandica TaxID=400682 RepID=A0A1X7UNI1_AMPQE